MEPTAHPSLTDPKESICSLGSRRKRHRVGLFTIGFFTVCSEKNDTIYTFLCKVDDLYPPYFVFLLVLSMVIMLYIFASFKQI